MRRFGSDEINPSFNARYRSQVHVHHHPVHGQASHLQVVPKVEPLNQQENLSPQVAFRKPSYSEEAAKSMAAAKPAASLANMASGTTFAAKARAAELNAVRNHKAKAQAQESEEKDPDTSMPAPSVGALRLTKPRSKGKGWKALNLEEIPETTAENEDAESHDANVKSDYATRTSTPNTSSLDVGPAPHGAPPSSQLRLHPSQRYQPSTRLPAQHVSYYHAAAQPVTTAVPRFTNEMPDQNAFTSPDHFRQQVHQIHHPALQHQQNGRHFDSGVPASIMASYRNAVQRSSESIKQQANATSDDPFVDMPAGLRGMIHCQKSLSDHRSEVTIPSTHGSSPEVQGKMDYEFKFPTYSQQGVHLPPPPGLPRPSVSPKALNGPLKPSEVKPPAPTADTHQRDPRPYTSFTRTSEDNSRKEKVQQHLQQVVDASRPQVNLPSSSRTVLYDPVTQSSNASSHLPEPRASKTTKDFLKASEPLPWKNRPVDIYNMLPPEATPPHVSGRERAAAAALEGCEMDGNAYIRSLLSDPDSAEQRRRNVEMWWKYDGRGQDQVRAYLEHVADQHQKYKSSREYDNIKKALERQASFRDDWSDDSDATTIPKALGTDGEVINRLLGPVIANLRSYAEDSSGGVPSYFNKFSKAPAWAIDGGMDGNRSFFGEDWGKPPPRVGRDPRYRPTFHEGRYTVFEPTDGRVSGRGGW
ncbi:MAG: hypothetical protein LQ344_004189 [Seirophora lacunosa]|nr:MAG: hypothetical protein LQ344_004189 [Seirophora lacunosa]